MTQLDGRTTTVRGARVFDPLISFISKFEISPN